MRLPIGALLVVMTLAAFGGGVLAGVPITAEQNGASDLHWARTRIRIEISNSLLAGDNSIKPGSDVTGAIRRSFATWSEATGVDFDLVWSDRLSVSPSGKTGDGVNLLTIAATPDNLLALGDADAAARTRVFFGRRGEISEADIVLNPVHQFSTDGSFGTFDLESAVTHEIGHLLGLDHIPVAGATMHGLQVRNGVFGLDAVNKRTLAESDLSAFRAVYDPASGGSVSGRLTLPGGRGAGGILVWAEEQDGGRVVAGRAAGAAGDFRLGGLARGHSYRVFAQGALPGNVWVSEELGTVSVGREVRLERRVTVWPGGPAFSEIGFNGQFADSVIPLGRGAAFVLYFAGSGRVDDSARISSTSDRFEFRSAPNVDFLGAFSVATARIAVDELAANGEYTLIADGPRGARRYFVGAVSLDGQSNPWTVYDLKSP